MKRFCVFTVVFLFAGVYSAAAQDLIIMKDGNVIEAKVMEVSRTEIRYKRFDHLDGPTIVIPSANVLSIRYENGTSQTITAAPESNTQPRSKKRVSNSAIDQDKFIFGVNANAGGALSYIWQGPPGFCLNFEFGKGNFNSEINLTFPIGGFGFLATFNRFWHSRIGGFYLGGGLGYSFFDIVHRLDGEEIDYYDYYMANSITVGINTGYKFVTRSGVYFRTGIFIGGDFGYLLNENTFPIYIKPDLAIGWMR